ncbi:putative tetratricopeptide-like helical domain superfamily [Plasmopara halstedii]
MCSTTPSKPMTNMNQKRQRVASPVSSPRIECRASDPSSKEPSDLSAVDAELFSINDSLQKEETSQKQTWQIGKRVKKLVESHEDLPTAKKLDAYFLWGTALARLASLNEDSTLAEAAADKFQLMLELSEDSGDEDAADAALGAVGFSLWGSSLLIVATETQNRHVLDEALNKFQRAVKVDGGTTFETRFQYAKALKEGGDLVTFLEKDKKEEGNAYYQRGLKECGKLESIYMEVSAKQAKQSRDEECDYEDDDTVLCEDFAEVKLLEAVLQGLLEDSSSIDDFHRTFALYREAISLNSSSTDALMEMTNYLAARCLVSSMQGVKPTASQWATLFQNLEIEYKTLLMRCGFNLEDFYKICKRKEDLHDRKESVGQEIDERVPYLLNTLGKGLATFVQAFPRLQEQTNKQKKKRKKSADARFTRAVELLRSAHHFHDKLGSYYLACLYASPAFEDENQCRTWLETADSYGALEDEFDVQMFTTMKEKSWFKRLIQPPEQVDEGDDNVGQHDE